MSIYRQKLNQLVAQRDILEIEASVISSELKSPGPNNEPPPGVKDPLVDNEGYPRSDIDILHIRQLRQRLSTINYDHKYLMKEIERLLPLVYSESNPDTLNSTISDSESTELSSMTSIVDAPSIIPIEDIGSEIRAMRLTPIATIDEIFQSSPASQASLALGDKLIVFGNITSQEANSLWKIPETVQSNIDKAIPVVVERNGNYLRLSITPKIWGGRGLLGCHLSPIMQ